MVYNKFIYMKSLYHIYIPMSLVLVITRCVIWYYFASYFLLVGTDSVTWIVCPNRPKCQMSNVKK